MAIALADKVAVVTGNGSTSSSSISLTLPGGIPANGRFLIACITTAANPTDANIATPTGWTAYNTINKTGAVQTWLFTRIASNETSATFTFSTSPAVNTWIGGVLEVWSGAHATTPILSASGWSGQSQSGLNTVSSPAQTPTVQNCVGVAFVTVNDIRTVSAFGWTLVAECGNAGGQYVDVFSSYKTGLAVSTAYNETVTFTAQTYAQPWLLSQTIILQPPPAIKNINITDTGATVSDKISVAETPYPGTAPDRAATMSDAPVISVTPAHSGTNQPFIRPFRYGRFK